MDVDNIDFCGIWLVLGVVFVFYLKVGFEGYCIVVNLWLIG